MPITEQHINRFIALYEKEYAVTLTVEQAHEELFKLLQLYRLIYVNPIPLTTSKTDLNDN